MKKIGILTYHWVYNFGANLQTLSTINFLKDKGYKPIIIDYRPKETEHWYEVNVNPVEIEAFKMFSHKYYRLTERCETIEEVNLQIEKFKISGVIIGSDSLFNLIKPYFFWRTLRMINPSPDHMFPNPFFGGLKCGYVGLSISSQNCKYKDFRNRKDEIGLCLKQFRRITVRDNWTRDMVKYFTNGEIVPEITPDPVFAFNYCNRNLIESLNDLTKRFQISSRYILYNNGEGILSKKWLSKFKDICELQSIELVELPHSLGKDNGKLKWPINPIEWYSLICNSIGYVGILMHPIVVSLHNSIPFFSFDHYGVKENLLESSKIYHIIKDSGFIDNYYNVKSKKKFPTPEDVWTRLKTFNKQKCSKFAMIQQEKCINNFMNTLKLL